MKLIERVTAGDGTTQWVLHVKTHAIALIELLRHPWASVVQIVLWLRESYEGSD